VFLLASVAAAGPFAQVSRTVALAENDSFFTPGTAAGRGAKLVQAKRGCGRRYAEPDPKVLRGAKTTVPEMLHRAEGHQEHRGVAVCLPFPWFGEAAPVAGAVDDDACFDLDAVVHQVRELVDEAEPRMIWGVLGVQSDDVVPPA
jgi:hypothetical protein